MKKLIKYSLIGGVILLILIVAGLVAAPYLLNLDSLRSYGEEYATGYLGRKVSIEDVGFSWAGPKVMMTGLTIAEAEGFGSEPFARLESFDLKLRLLDLFRLRLTVEHVVLSSPRIRVARNSEGRFNFDDILERINRPAATAGGPLAAMAPGEEGIKAPPIDLLVDEIRMEDGQVHFSDATSPRLARGISMDGVRMTVRDLSLDRPVTIAASLGLGGQARDLEFTGTVGPVGRTILPGKIPFDLQLSILPFELSRLPGLVGPLPVGVSGVVTAQESVKGSLDAGVTFEASMALSKLGVADAAGKQVVKGFDGAIQEKGRLDVRGRSLYLESLRVDAYQATLDASGKVLGLGPAPTVELSVSSNAVPLSGWDVVLPGLGPMMKLGGDLTFRGKVTGKYGKDLSARLAFTSERFEADRGPALLARSSSKAVAPPVGAAPLKPIKAPPITVSGSVTVKQGRFEKIAFSDMKADLSQKGTRFSLDQMALTAFSGQLQGKAWTDLGLLPLTYGAEMKMDGVQVNDALAAVAGLEGILYTRASMDVSISGKGTEMADLQKHLTGQGAMKGTEGRLTTANLAGGAAKAASILGLGEEGGETRFEDMDASFTIADGKVKVSSMRLATGQWSMVTKGDIGLDQSLDLTSRMTLSQQATARIPEQRRRLFPREKDGRVQLPLKIGGTVTSPKVGLDSAAMSQAAKEELKEEVQQKTEERKEELKDKIQKDLGERLKKLF
ncbi:MAG: AsmA family protein [bacterium]|nr:MAG: AsmA family protein [bacterium]